MKHISLAMHREHLHDIPEAPLLDGYSIRMYQDGDEQAWADIETLAGEFPNREAAQERFNREFGSYLEEMKLRCLFLVNPSGRLVGTTTAWRGNTLGDLQGRIHWVGIIPEEQGKKLANPLLTQALRVLADLQHESAYLTTQTTSWPAVSMYLKYGFKPYRNSDTCAEGWALIEQQLGRRVD